MTGPLTNRIRRNTHRGVSPSGEAAPGPLPRAHGHGSDRPPIRETPKRPKPTFPRLWTPPDEDFDSPF